MDVVWALGLAVVGLLAGYAIGRWHEREAQRERREHMLRVEPPERDPGQPTNLAGPPSRVTPSRYLNRRWASEEDLQG